MAEPSYEIRVIGAHENIFSDIYHAFLRMKWPALLAAILGAFLAINMLFALAFMMFGGVYHMRPGSFEDAFYFSAQTMGTIGYGAMYPDSRAANLVVVAESFVSLLVTALSTGLVFTKFSRPVGRVAFSKQATISLMDGKPTLSFRLGNERKNTILEGAITVSLSRTIRTAEGMLFYRLTDLKLARDHSPAIARSWTVLHTIDETSPLFGATPESLESDDAELIASLVGMDDTSYQPVHARHAYDYPDIVWGQRHADILTENGDGSITLDVRKFHDLTPMKPTADFPYPRSAKTIRANAK